IHMFRYLISHFSAFHEHKGPPGELPPEREAMWREAMANPDYAIYTNVKNVVTQKGQHMPAFFQILINPYDNKAATEQAEKDLSRIKVPTYTGLGWYAYTYKGHLNGAQNYFEKIEAPSGWRCSALRIWNARFTRCTTKCSNGTTSG
ncbi:MAG TPA: hypothetical protein VKA94_10385, partial [Hyphomicrobiales bacterium]|nr:hypothetical protein [Hyphomicrobiales bacterium]